MQNMIHDDGDDTTQDFITISVGDMHAWILEAMIALSDGLAWHTAAEPDKDFPLVMASPDECADAAVYGILMKLSEDGMSDSIDDAPESGE